MADDLTVQRGKVTDLVPDAHNANKGTERGLAMLESSLRRYGVGRGVVVDRHGRIIGGNKTVERLVDLGLTDMVVVPTDGHTLVVTQRTDLDLDTDPAARELAYADNRVGQVDLDFDLDVLLADLQRDDLNLSDLWRDWELEQLQALVKAQEFDPSKEWEGMPEYEQDTLKPFHSVIVHFATEQNMEEFASLVNQVVTKQTRFINIPMVDEHDPNKEAGIDVKHWVAVNES